ncbi:cytospin-A isoform X3 [Hyalella azteca]|uniref:Cytospin-A isoform X3 n=1 Tax=Hyalella azteca TaxID=294128 RepID=A0A979FTE9_HYAAZ|nr:cytospin-A isoform X3 [Hyalella azteca]
MGPPRVVSVALDSRLRALSPLSRPSMAARVAHSPRPGLSNGLDSLGAAQGCGRRVRAVSQTRAPASSPRPSTAKTRSASAQRVPLLRAATTNSLTSRGPRTGVTPASCASPLVTVRTPRSAQPSNPKIYTNSSNAAQKSNKPVVTPVRPTRGPIVTPNRKASAPPKISNAPSSLKVTDCNSHNNNINNSNSSQKPTTSRSPEVSSSRAVETITSRSTTYTSVARSGRVPNSVAVRRKPTPHSNVFLANNPDFCLAPYGCDGSTECLCDTCSKDKCIHDRHRVPGQDPYNGHCFINTRKTSCSSSTDHGNDSNSSKGSLSSTDSAELSSSNASSDSGCSELRISRRNNNIKKIPRRTVTTATITAKTRKTTDPINQCENNRSKSKSPYARSISQPNSNGHDQNYQSENDLKLSICKTPIRETLKARIGHRIHVNGYRGKPSAEDSEAKRHVNGGLTCLSTPLKNVLAHPSLQSSSSENFSPCSLDQSERFNHEAAFLDDLPGGTDGFLDSPVCTSSPAILTTLLRISKDHGGSKPSSEQEVGASAGELRKVSAPSVLLPVKRSHGREGDGVFSSTDPGFLSNKEDKSSKPVKFKKMSNTFPKDTNIPEEQEIMEVTSAPTVQSMPVPTVEVHTVTALKSCPPQTIVVPTRSGSSTFYDKVVDMTTKSEGPAVSAMITINSVVPQLSSTATPAVDISKKSVLENTKHSLVVEPVAPARRNSKSSKEDECSQLPKNPSDAVSGVSVEPVKSVSITKLENDTECKSKTRDEILTKEVSVPEKTIAKVEKRISPTKNNPTSAETSAVASSKSTNQTNQVQPAKQAPTGGNESKKLTDHSSSIDSSQNATSDSKKLNIKENETFCEDLNAEENAKYTQEKVIRLEKMVSDLVKNAEIKKQEIAAFKMQIKRLKELVRDRDQISDEDPNGVTKKKKNSVPQPTSSGGGNDVASAAPAPASCTTERLEELLEENRVLRSQLLHLGGSLNSSRLSDQEKEALLKGGSWGERSTTGATIGDWDNKSSSSEVSVACLQDRIMQMEETHYCTNEELQATLQELDDLREQLAESQAELENMQEEKQVLLASLTQQTNFLTESRGQNQTLKQLLIQQSENSQTISSCVNSQKLLELLKSVEEDHERLEMKQEDVEAQLAAAKVAEHRFLQDSQMYRDRMKSLEGLLECSSAAKAAAEAQTAELQEALKAEKVETCRLQEALTTAKEHIAELEARLVGGGSVSEVLEAVRAENSKLEQRVAELTQQLHAATRDAEKTKEIVNNLQDKLKAEESARDGLHDASARSERLEEKRRSLLQQVANAEKSLAEAKQTAQRHLQHKRELKTALSESQKLLTQAQEEKRHCEQLNLQQKQQFEKQVEEWEQFQCDLLTTVRVANDFKTEVQAHLEKVQHENALLKHQLSTLEKKAANCRVCSGATKYMSSPSGGGDRRNADRALTRTDSKVKSLIESLENGVPITRGSGRISSNNGLDNNIAIGMSCVSSGRKSAVTSAPILKRADTDGVIRPSPTASPLKESGNIDAASPVSPLRSLQRNSFSDGLSSISSPTPSSKVNVPPPSSPTANLPDTVKMSQLGEKAGAKLISEANKPISILSNKIEPRKNNFNQLSADKKDPLSMLAQGGGSRRNALLKWCQNQTLGYSQVDITNFSSSWNDGLALCAILDTYVPEKINYRSLNHSDKRANFEKALAAAESVGIPSTLDVNDMMNSERPNWQTVYNYVTSIYAHFET